MTGKGDDSFEKMAASLGDLNALSLEDLGGPDEPLGLEAGPAPEPRTENSFADARLDAPPAAPLTPGAQDSNAQEPGAIKIDPPPPSGAQGLDLALVEGGAVMVSAKDKALMTRAKQEATPETPSLEARGATSIAAPVQTGPVPAGHIARPRGVFAWDPVTNILAAAAISLGLAALPAYLMASSHAQSDEVEAAFEKIRSLRSDLIDIADPGRAADGPQDLEAVAAALTDTAAQIDAQAAEVDERVGGAHVRFWGLWLGLGLPMGVALALIRRKG